MSNSYTTLRAEAEYQDSVTLNLEDRKVQPWERQDEFRRSLKTASRYRQKNLLRSLGLSLISVLRTSHYQ